MFDAHGITLSLLCLMLAATAASGRTVNNVNELYDHLARLPTPTLGVISTGNFDSVHHLVPSDTTAVIFNHVADLVDAVLNGSVSAGLTSGLPPSADRVVTFSSTLVSPRSMFTCGRAECGTVVEALDAAVVRALNSGADVQAARGNAPFEYVSVHTCRTNLVDRFPFPTPSAGDRLRNATIRGTLRIAALGPYNWGNAGDYTKEKPTGFWPELLSAIEYHFQNSTGIGFERVFAMTSDAAMAMVDSGIADATEPYWTVDAYYNGRSRQHTFAPSCTIHGYDSTFFVAPPAAGAEGGGSTPAVESGPQVSAGLVAGIAVLGALLLLSVPLIILAVRRRERRAAHKFRPLQPTASREDATAGYAAALSTV